ncbi:MAG: Spy/CpxP family protein refolding chaperone [Muribaculaceae bacterium]|nr:Spy/CpxP family protein refolding chaperone [Muribaculaceae bacterium]
MRVLLLNILLCLSAFMVPAMAQQEQKGQKALAEYRSFQRDFFAKQLNLTADQREKFCPLYEEMQNRLDKLAQETFTAGKALENDKDATEAELEAFARKSFEQRKLEGEIEMEYYEKFKTILTPKQLSRIKLTERNQREYLRKYVRDRNHAGKQKK